MAKASSGMLTVTSLKATGKTIKQTDMVLITISMGLNMKAHGRMIFRMEKV